MGKIKNRIITGDSLNILKTFQSDSIDAIVTDPPYGLSFIGLKWDKNVPTIDLWKETLRVLKPGGYLLAFSSARTYHHLALNIEKAGFEIRDQIMWLYSSGFPRSYNIGVAVEKKYGAQLAQNWHGWGTTLKPAHEPIVVARKPIIGPVADNVIEFCTGGLNISASRVGDDEMRTKIKKNGKIIKLKCKGRFPANVIHDGSSNEHWLPYFYCAKPTTAERDHGLEKMKIKKKGAKSKTAHKGCTGTSLNFHPTVKPIALMEYLIKLVTPANGIVLDPFAGSGSTLIAAKNLNHPFIGIEKEADYVKIAQARLVA